MLLSPWKISEGVEKVDADMHSQSEMESDNAMEGDDSPSELGRMEPLSLKCSEKEWVIVKLQEMEAIKRASTTKFDGHIAALMQILSM
jgi:hypothetical protein